ncbi:hypothetical protein ACP275_08G000500 [Erythranthe tilingii]
MRASSIFLLILPLAVLFSNFVFPIHNLGFCAEQQNNDMTTLGGLKDTNTEIDSLARFAVEQHNNKEVSQPYYYYYCGSQYYFSVTFVDKFGFSFQNALLELVRVVNAKEQVVAGSLHHLTLEVVDAGIKKLYEAKVWVKPWMHFKELQEFKHVPDVPPFTSSDLGVKKGSQPLSSYFSFICTSIFKLVLKT